MECSLVFLFFCIFYVVVHFGMATGCVDVCRSTLLELLHSVVSFHDCPSSIVVVSEARGAKSFNSLYHFEWSHLPL